MKFHPQFVLAALIVVLMTLLSVPAYAAKTPNGGHEHTQTYHDRTPRVHAHGSHPRHG